MDSHRDAALHLLTSPLLEHKTEGYISEVGQIDWDAMFDESYAWSSGERLVLCLAAKLFGPGIVREPLAITDLIDTLDDGNWELALEALRIRRGGRTVRV